jgi:hypothetical protein
MNIVESSYVVLRDLEKCLGAKPELFIWTSLYNHHNCGHCLCPVFCLKHDVSETGFCLRIQVEPTYVGPIETTNLCLRTGLSRFHPKTGRESSLRNVVF